MDQRILAGTSYIAWDDTAAWPWQYVEVNGTVLKLTPTQYRLCRAFLAASAASETKLHCIGQFAILSYQSYDQLLNLAGLTRRATLMKHISHLNARVATVGLEFCSFQGGYILTFSSKTAKNSVKR